MNSHCHTSIFAFGIIVIEDKNTSMDETLIENQVIIS